MKTVRILLIALLLTAAGGMSAAKADDAAKRKDIVQLLEVTGTLKIFDQAAVGTFQRLMAVTRRSNPNIPQGALDVMEKECVAFMHEKSPEIAHLFVPIYEQTFTHQEIKDILAFYGTKTGKKMVATMPMLLKQSNVAAQKYLANVGPELKQRIVAKLRAAGYR